MTGYVYTKQNVLVDELKEFLQKLSTKPSYYFLRSPHAVSGICMQLPKEFPSFEGQMFNADCELRWKKQKSGYDLLILSKEEVKLEGIHPVGSNWEIREVGANFNKNEPKFPKKFIFNDLNGEGIKPETIPISQRYFLDKFIYWWCFPRSTASILSLRRNVSLCNRQSQGKYLVCT